MSKSVFDKVGDWKLAFDAISEELTPRSVREIKTIMESEKVDVGALAAAERLARLIAANDRAAALAAAVLTSVGVARTITAEEFLSGSDGDEEATPNE